MGFARPFTPVPLPRARALALALLLPLFMAAPLAGRAADIDPVAPALPPVTAWPHSTVVCRDGTFVRDVTLSWVLDGYLLEAIAADGTVTTLAPSHVKAVLAPDGSDLTDIVGAACPAHDVDFRLLGRGSRTPFTFTVMGDAGAGLAIGTVRGGAGPVPVLLGGLRASLGGRLHARLGLRRQGLEQEPDLGGAAFSSASTDVLVLVGGRLKDPRENDNYAYLEGGLVLVRFDERFGDGPDLARSAHGAAAQGGVVLPLSASRGVDIGVTAMSRPPLLDGAGHSLMVSFNVALTLRGGGR